MFFFWFFSFLFNLFVDLFVDFSYTPEPHIAFCPFLSTHFFEGLNPMFKKWVIFVRRRPCVCDTLKFESTAPPEKRSILARTPSSPPRTTTIELPECHERRGAKTMWSALGPTGLHTTARELQTGTFEGPGLQSHHQNSTKRLPREEERWEKEKKERNFGRSGGGRSTDTLHQHHTTLRLSAGPWLKIQDMNSKLSRRTAKGFLGSTMVVRKSLGTKRFD